MILDLFFIFTILYVIQICVFAYGAHKAHYNADPSLRPTVSIIIAARNEAANMRACLDSIVRLTYPKNLLEVIVVNDRSTDSTASIIEEFAGQHTFVKLLNASESQIHHLVGKTNAVAQGVKISYGEILLFTDADCTVPEGWVEETVKYYDAEEVGLVAGFTSLRARNLFESIQAIDWFVLFSIAAATIRLHFPVTAVGNNLSVRRKAYDAVGGYEQIPFSVTEDYALFHAVTSTGTYIAKFPVDHKTLVHSLPCPTWHSLFRQKKRWFVGGAEMDAKSISLFVTGYVFKALLVATIFVNGPTAIILPFVLKCVVDFLLMRPALSRFNRMRLLFSFLAFEVYYIVYVVFFPPLVLLNKTVSWKEREFR